MHVGELRHLWSAGLSRGGLCGCGVPVDRCDFWKAVLGFAFPGGTPDPATVIGWQRAAVTVRNFRGLLTGAALRSEAGAAYARTFDRLYRALGAVSGAAVVVDSSKSPVHGALVSHVVDGNVRFVHLVRDPRAIAYSWMRGKPNPGFPAGRMWRIPAWRAARVWVVANAMAERLGRRRPYLLLRYEDFVAEPTRSVREVASLVGGTPGTTPTIESHAIDLPVRHTASGNPVRLKTGRVELREDDAWRTAQRPLHRFLVTAMTLPLLHRYGYPLSVGRGGS